MPNNVTFRVGAKGAAQTSSEMDNLRDKFASLQKQGAKGFGLGVAAGAGVFALGAIQGAAQGLVGAIGDSVQKASDLNETIQKSQVVFGSAAGDIKAWGEMAAKSMGLSENAAIGAAASIGNLLLSTGTAPAKVAPMSKAIVKLASDLASFNNISVDDALAKLQSGLVGQERPLRELGVAISAASVDTEAAALGFKKLNGEFTEGEKVQARYSLIFKQTATAQGDFARTSDQLANTQRTLNANMDDTSAKLGKSLTPSVTLADKILNQLGLGLADFADKTTQAGEATGDFVRKGVEGWKQFFSETGNIVQATTQIDTFHASLDETAAQARNTSRDLGGVNTVVGHIPPTFTTAKSTVDDLAGALDRARTKANTLATDLETNLYGTAVNLGRKEELTGQISDLEAKLKHTKDAHTATIIKGQIAGLRQSLMDLDLQIAIAKGPQALVDQLHAWEKQFKLTNHQAYLAVLALEKLYGVAGMLPDVKITISGTGTTSGKNTSKQAASGGTFGPGEHGTVGEAGIEDITNVGGVAVIRPRSGGRAPTMASVPMSAQTGGNVTLNVSLHLPNAYGMTPSQAEALGRQIGPSIATFLNRRGLLGSTRRGVAAMT